MPVENPDGEMAIDVRFYTDDEYSGPVEPSIDEWTKSNGEKTDGVSGFMRMREFYDREHVGEPGVTSSSCSPARTCRFGAAGRQVGRRRAS